MIVNSTSLSPSSLSLFADHEKRLKGRDTIFPFFIKNADLHVGDEKMAFLRLFGKKSTISKQFFVIQNKLHDIIYHFR